MKDEPWCRTGRLRAIVRWSPPRWRRRIGRAVPIAVPWVDYWMSKRKTLARRFILDFLQWPASWSSSVRSDEELRRSVQTATLHDCDARTYNAEAQRLFDVRLLAMSPQAFTLTGLERIEGIEYAQSWLVG